MLNRSVPPTYRGFALDGLVPFGALDPAAAGGYSSGRGQQHRYDCPAGGDHGEVGRSWSLG